MLTLKIPSESALKIHEALLRNGVAECGGILMAEHVGRNEFTVRDLTVHRRGGFASFVRRIEDAITALNAFFHRANKEYKRFNYIGEWHSHPSFSELPSDQDNATMQAIADDPMVGANFVVLLVVRLNSQGVLLGSAHAYLPQQGRIRSILVIEKYSKPRKLLKFI